MFLENTDIIEENDDYLIEDFFSHLLEESVFLMQINEKFNEFEKKILTEQHFIIVEEETGWEKTKEVFRKIIDAVKNFFKQLGERLKQFIKKFEVKIRHRIISDNAIKDIKKDMDHAQRSVIFFSKTPGDIIKLFKEKNERLDDLLDPKIREKADDRKLEKLTKRYDDAAYDFRASIKKVNSIIHMKLHKNGLNNMIDAIKEQRDGFARKANDLQRVLNDDIKDLNKLESDLKYSKEEDKSQIQEKISVMTKKKKISSTQFSHFIKYSQELSSFFLTVWTVIKRMRR